MPAGFKPKGLPKTGGRQKGTPNKKTDLFRMCEERGICVFTELLNGAASEDDPDKRFLKFKDIAPYLYAKKKEIELDVDMDLAKRAEEYAALDKGEQLKLMKEEVKRIEEEIYYEETKGPSGR